MCPRSELCPAQTGPDRACPVQTCVTASVTEEVTEAQLVNPQPLESLCPRGRANFSATPWLFFLHGSLGSRSLAVFLRWSLGPNPWLFSFMGPWVPILGLFFDGRICIRTFRILWVPRKTCKFPSCVDDFEDEEEYLDLEDPHPIVGQHRAQNLGASQGSHQELQKDTKICRKTT